MSENLIFKGCKGCDYEKKAPAGICTIQKASDGFDIRCVGKWAEENIIILENISRYSL